MMRLRSKEISAGKYLYEFRGDHIWVTPIPFELEKFVKENTENYIFFGETGFHSIPRLFYLEGTSRDDLQVLPVGEWNQDLLDPFLMEPGKELDKLIAKKVFGLDPEQFSRDQSYYETMSCGPLVEPYSTSIEAAWKVVEAIQDIGFQISFCNYENGRTWRVGFKYGRTASHAICLAALYHVSIREEMSIKLPPGTRAYAFEWD